MAVSSKNLNPAFSIALRITNIAKIIAIVNFATCFEILHMSF
jgi:hypothetical protein